MDLVRCDTTLAPLFVRSLLAGAKKMILKLLFTYRYNIITVQCDAIR